MRFPAQQNGPIGVFDSGYGGLTVLREIMAALPAYDYVYLGDNARVPYGTRSFETVYRYTLECVEQLFALDCPLVILACNTASAKALRTIQQKDLPGMAPDRRVLGVIRPTTEIIGNRSLTGHIGVFATPGTVNSGSYLIEIEKFFPEVKVTQEACPMWVPLVENNEHLSPGAEYFIRKHTDALLAQDPDIDTVLLACTHYPLLMPQLRKALPAHIRIISQGPIVAGSLTDYLRRHPELDSRLTRKGRRSYFTTESSHDFDQKAAIFLGEAVRCTEIRL